LPTGAVAGIENLVSGATLSQNRNGYRSPSVALRLTREKNIALNLSKRRILGALPSQVEIPGSSRLNRQEHSSRREDQAMINATFRAAIWKTIAAGLLGLGAFLILPYPSIAGESPSAPVTFAKDVAPILQAKCQECHHKGTAAQLSLTTYEETRKQAALIKQRVATRNMPPWHIDRTVGIQKFKNDRSLTDDQINTIVRWVDSGTPFGDPKDLPADKKWPSDDVWQLAEQFGQPDIIVKSAPYTVPAHGQDAW
jgi:hypothetical protein